MTLLSRITILFVALLVAAPGYAREGTITRETDLKLLPKETAKRVAMLPAGSVVDIKGRSGFWLRVQVSAAPAQAAKAVGKSGWVKFIRVRDRTTAGSNAQQQSAGGFFASISRSVTGIFGGGRRNTRTSPAITTGIRGLSANDLETAAPDMDAVNKLRAWRASVASAANFADQGKLNPAQIAYFAAEPLPVAEQSSDSGTESPGESPADNAGEDRMQKILKFFTSTPSKAKQNSDDDEGMN